MNQVPWCRWCTAGVGFMLAFWAKGLTCMHPAEQFFQGCGENGVNPPGVAL